MSKKKQSSVDFLISGLLEYIHESHHLEVLELYEKAKEIHKEELIYLASSWSHERVDRIDIENDYNETFE